MTTEQLVSYAVEAFFVLSGLLVVFYKLSEKGKGEGEIPLPSSRKLSWLELVATALCLMATAV